MQKDKKQTNKQTQPPQVFPLTTTVRLITIVNCIHKRDISKTKINQYELSNRPNQKLNNKKQTASPSPNSQTTHHRCTVPKTIARQTTLFVKISKEWKLNQSPQRKTN